MQPLDIKGMQFVHQARLEMAAKNRRGYVIVKTSRTNNSFRKVWNKITLLTSRIENSHKFGKKSNP